MTKIWSWIPLAAAVLAVGCSTAQTPPPPAAEPASLFQGSGPALPPLRSATHQPLEVRRSSQGVLDTSLTVKYGDNVIGNDKVHLRSYEGKLTGPTLRVRPGDTLRIAFRNDLPGDPNAAPHAHHSNTPTAAVFNDTNLHTHGLHVSPRDPADNVLLVLGPGDTHQFEFKIPTDHPAGTFWYHAHVHGATAIQVSSGMAGVLIVEGGLDEVPEIQAAADETLLFQQIQYYCGLDSDGKPIYDCTGKVGEIEQLTNVFGNNTWTPSGRYTTINGVVQPVIRMKAGEVQRWRLLHGGVRETLKVSVSDQQYAIQPGWLHEIAKDGLATGRIDAIDSDELEPGYRSDVLVQAPTTAGRYYLIDEKTAANESLLAEAEPRKVLAVIEVSTDQVTMSLPTSAQLAGYRPFRDIEDAELTGTQSVYFNVTGFTVGTTADNGKAYDPNDPPRTLKLGAVEEWTVNSIQASHPFHIHVNPFQIMEKGADGKLRPGDWKDTLMVKAGDSNQIVVRSRYEDFDGAFVLHCHILDHEDQGMMQGVEIVR
jgi:FtsP/CotA-like multicopper oxidase with cupredoxin domain